VVYFSFRISIDNLKAAVQQADWYDPEVHPKLQAFAAHYGAVFHRRQANMASGLADPAIQTIRL